MSRAHSALAAIATAQGIFSESHSKREQSIALMFGALSEAAAALDHDNEGRALSALREAADLELGLYGTASLETIIQILEAPR